MATTRFVQCLSDFSIKYYPLVEKAIWASEVFKLEPLPESDEGYGLLRKVTDYYPELWRRACSLP